ncbi:serine/threonine-protein kinase [Archangium gephyra]|uniref:Serine/threonine-protein kinase n=1 Tax=Archangium gephyra TaxID=48 RepID=A0AAC8Q7W4_9BACT|nr:serine/threonine-protein kinase [Archangium gephyra]AKJ02439.1 serine/threonine protein kinase [Archangium gephyra]REG28635.1 serine/threonine-protein kinase [Archangium gephyra]
MLSPGTRVGEYVIVRRVAVGATSDVYEGRHAARGEPVAVKVLSPTWCVHAEVVARFLNEARTLEEFQHPRLVKGLASGVLSEGPPFMVLEWLPVDLHQALARAGGRLPEPACARIIRQLAEVLAALHARGLVHRDLKPANVLLARQEPDAWEVKLADLGLAKRMAPQGTETPALPVSTAGNALLGTWDYMAPEQWIQSKSVDFRADVYALGVLWFQLLAGRLPFIGGEKSLMHEHLLAPPPLHLLEGLATGPTRAMVGRMLGKTMAERPTLDEVLARVSATVG